METTSEWRRHLGAPAMTIVITDTGADSTDEAVWDTRTGEPSLVRGPAAGAAVTRLVMYPWNSDYASAVAAIVRTRYSSHAMEAVVNNYLADPTGDDAIEEMREMQAWRAAAKALAKEALAYAEEAEG